MKNSAVEAERPELPESQPKTDECCNAPKFRPRIALNEWSRDCQYQRRDANIAGILAIEGRPSIRRAKEPSIATTKQVWREEGEKEFGSQRKRSEKFIGDLCSQTVVRKFPCRQNLYCP